MSEYHLSAPFDEATMRKLQLEDRVFLDGTLFGIRDATLIHRCDRGRTTRFDLRGHAVIHTAPNAFSTIEQWIEQGALNN